MAFFVFGTSTKATTAQRGTFYCPQCACSQPYELKIVKQYGTLYFIPAVSMGEKGAYVECQRCHGTFVPEVLRYDSEAAAKAFEAEVQKGIRRVTVQMMMADGAIADAEVHTIQEIFRQLTNRELTETEIRREAESLFSTSERELLEFLASLALGLNDQGKELIVKTAFWVAGADKRVEDEEEAFMFRIGKALGMSKAHVQAVMDMMTVRRGSD